MSTTWTKTTRLTTDDLILLWEDVSDSYLVWNDSNDPLIYGAVTNWTPREEI